MSREYEVSSPFNGSVVGRHCYASSEEVGSALNTLSGGKKRFAALAPSQRADILEAFAAGLRSDKDALAERLCLEIGKTLRDARIEIERASNTLRAASHEARRSHGELLHSDSYPPLRDRWGLVHRKPLGLLLAITPFNFPINLAVHKLGPAFAVGCPVFFKPSPQNYESGKRLVEIAYAAGVPSETLQFCMADITELGAALSDERVAIISFTGSVGAAQSIAAQAPGKKLLFELGGNDPLIVMDDGDVEAAVKATVDQRFATAGQRCTAAKRVFVHSSRYEEFRATLVEAAGRLCIGDPMKEDTFVGPVISARAADEIMRRIDLAVAAGGNVLCGNQRDGNIVHPTVIEDVPFDCALVADETFGPVVPLFSFNSLDELIEKVNGSGFGLQSGVFTQKLDIVRRLFDELEVGALAVNDGPGFRAEHFPFGGIGKSGLGREGVRYAMEEMTYLKTLVW